MGGGYRLCGSVGVSVWIIAGHLRHGCMCVCLRVCVFVFMVVVGCVGVNLYKYLVVGWLAT